MVKLRIALTNDSFPYKKLRGCSIGKFRYIL